MRPFPRRDHDAGSGAGRQYLYQSTGVRGETVTDVSQQLLAHHAGLRGLLRPDVAELARIRELGEAKAVRVKAALELGRRLAALSSQPLIRLACADVAPVTGGRVVSLVRSCSRKT